MRTRFSVLVRKWVLPIHDLKVPKGCSTVCRRLACTFPYRRFADILADACARLRADVVRYSFIVADLHHLLLAGLPAHLRENDESDMNRLAITGRFDEAVH